MPQKFKNILKLLCVCLALWFFFAVLTPILEDHIPAWKRYNQISAEKGLDSGAIYYSDVPVSQEAEEIMREAVERGMAARRDALRQK
ncbi:MAG: hypothetical protein K2H64_04885 [Desulfovibrio sp.]|nr:hypothetical protein [Desulfovibrio sp.]